MNKKRNNMQWMNKKWNNMQWVKVEFLFCFVLEPKPGRRKQEIQPVGKTLRVVNADPEYLKWTQNTVPFYMDTSYSKLEETLRIVPFLNSDDPNVSANDQRQLIFDAMTKVTSELHGCVRFLEVHRRLVFCSGSKQETLSVQQKTIVLNEESSWWILQSLYITVPSRKQHFQTFTKTNAKIVQKTFFMDISMQKTIFIRNFFLGVCSTFRVQFKSLFFFATATWLRKSIQKFKNPRLEFFLPRHAMWGLLLAMVLISLSSVLCFGRLLRSIILVMCMMCAEIFLYAQWMVKWNCFVLDTERIAQFQAENHPDRQQSVRSFLHLFSSHLQRSALVCSFVYVFWHVFLDSRANQGLGCRTIPGVSQTIIRDGGTKQSMVLAPGPNGCFDGNLGNLMKYFVLVLGRRNEHQRPDRDSYINVNMDNIQPGQHKKPNQTPPHASTHMYHHYVSTTK